LVSDDFQISFSKEAELALRTYTWPGNMREMISVFELCLALCDGETIEVCDLPDEFQPD